MAYSEIETAVLKKYRILTPTGELTNANLKSPLVAGGKPPGPGPLMSPDVIARLITADTTPDKRWLDWIFFQAGGGIQAKNTTVDALRQIRDRFIDERTNGWTHPATNEYQKPVPRAEAEARWVKNEPRFRESLAVCDQDSVKRLRCFGYFRDWPGNANKYANVVDTISKFLKLYAKLEQMNKEVARDGAEPQDSTPETLETWEEMAEVTKKVERYFASKQARTDIREETIYDDDTITALAPLTYAASVRYGYDKWPWSKRKGFDDTLNGDPSNYRHSDEWKNSTSQGTVFVFLTFKVPVPAWITRQSGNWELKDLTDLALRLDINSAKQHSDDWKVFDQENREMLTISSVKEMIKAEPTRSDPTDDESPFKRGGNVYKNEHEAAEVVASLNRAVAAIKKWVLSFDSSKIKTNALTLD